MNSTPLQIKFLYMNQLKFVFHCLLMVLPFQAFASDKFQIDNIIGHIEALENVSDPKCYATASRLEDFIYGTPLSDDARFAKNLFQKEWLKSVWHQASKLATAKKLNQISNAILLQTLAPQISWSNINGGHWEVLIAQKHNLKIHKDDKRQYGSIAYSLRSMLALQQEIMMQENSELVFSLLPISDNAADTLTEALDFFILSVLQVADRESRARNQYEIGKDTLSSVWQGMLNLIDVSETASEAKEGSGSKVLQPIKPVLIGKMIEQKIRSYSQYNELQNQLFVRNLQVFFARNRWPSDSLEARKFRQAFTEHMISFASELYKGAQEIALSKDADFIREESVHRYAQSVLPYEINEYEDAIFFHNLEDNRRVTIESYDMDAFRDSGIHWMYLKFALTDNLFPIYLELDPFAAELLVENVAQYGVLLLRLTGDIGREQDKGNIEFSHFRNAIEEIEQRVDAHKAVVKKDKRQQQLTSSDAYINHTKLNNYFTDTTNASGIDFMHRSSDWLSRLLRSYLRIDAESGTITIPPAFGGSGVAVGDINNDNFDDVLILGGLGNKLFLNDGKGGFEDVTEATGIGWVRSSSNLPGETRQPLIADLDNDGWQDIIITYVNDKHRVYRNKGDGTFEDKTDVALLGGQASVGGPATLFDYDNDGLLDVYITYFGDYLKGTLPTLKRVNTNGLPNKLYKNMGSFKFKDVTDGSGVDNTGWGQAVTHTDFDGDGLQDLIVGNDFGINAYYKNLGTGRFKDVAASLGTNKPSYTMGIALTDLNGDLTSDVYISNIVTMNKDEKYILPSNQTEMKFNPEKLARMRVVEANDLFISNKNSDGTLIYRKSEQVGRGYSTTGWSWGADFLDFDNDGDDDLYVVNGMNDYNVYSQENPYYQDPKGNEKDVTFPVSNKENNVFFVNENGILKNSSAQSGINFNSNSRSIAYFDMDNDGDLDIIVNGYHEKARLLRNNLQSLERNWLKIKLIGAPEAGVNLDAIGAKIIVTTKDGLVRVREINGSTAYQAVHSKIKHFGLLDNSTVEVKIVWPNGHQSNFGEIGANQTLTFHYKSSEIGTIR